MSDFLLWPSLLGGGLIGLAAALLLWTTGRVAGVSGIVGGMLGAGGDLAWRLLFVTGLVLGGFLYQWLGGTVAHIQPVVADSWLVLAGLLVGVGATLGSGCTSGHGVCGLARLSPRSLVATLTFMASGALVATLLHGGA